jgi:hypothetical protein
MVLGQRGGTIWGFQQDEATRVYESEAIIDRLPEVLLAAEVLFCIVCTDAWPNRN